MNRFIINDKNRKIKKLWRINNENKNGRKTKRS